MPYHSHSRFRSVGFVVLAAAAVAALLALVYLLAVHRDGDDPGYEPPALAKDRASDGSADRDRDRGRHESRGTPSSSDGGSGGPDWFSGLGSGTSASPGPHQAVISVTTAPGAAVGLKYAFRTPGGIRSATTQASSSWTSSDTVSGIEPLAGVIAQVASGTVSCTVRIDGRVTMHKTSSGAFATVTCAG